MKAKRFISGVIALAVSSVTMVSGFVSAADGANVLLKGEHIEKTAGSSFELDIDLSKLAGEAAQGFSGCEFAITYNPAKIQNVKITEGKVLSSTGATAAELDKSSTIKDEITMVNSGSYNCFDYNIVEKEGKDTTVALLWCTGLDSSKYWAKGTGTLLTVSGTVYKDATEGEEIPINIVPIDRDGNKDLIFGYIDGTIDKVYSAAVEQNGLIKVVKDTPDTSKILWGDVNDNKVVSASDLVAMVQFILDPEKANLTDQGKKNGNLYQGDKNTDLTSDEILNAQDLFLLKAYLLEDLSDEQLPIMDMTSLNKK